jgi:predicted metal-dependent HD superfamily phosphohydrolase
MAIVDDWFSIIRDLHMQTWRKYHNLNHIYIFIKLAYDYKDKIKDHSSVLFSIWFHDIIYTPSRSDNEEVNKILI